MPLPLLLPKHGPILAYIKRLHAAKATREVDQIHAAARALAATSDGAILLDLLHKAIEDQPLDPLGDERALVAHAAQRLIVSDLRRIVSDERERMEEQAAARTGRRKPGAG